MQKHRAPITVVVFSESLCDRDYLRNQLAERGYNTICFENENSFIDNLKSLQPKAVIARTDSSEVGWRLVFALNLLRMNKPLVFISHTLSVNIYNTWPLSVPIYALPVQNNGGHWITNIDRVIKKETKSNCIITTPPFLGESDGIKAIRLMLPKLSHSKDPIMIVGEKGVGKELLTRNIAGLFSTPTVIVKVDCGAHWADKSLSNWMTEIVEKEKSSKSIIIHLHNIHHMSHAAQADTLLFLDKVENWISNTDAHCTRDIRIITTSELNLESLVKKGTFRKDLYFRLNVIPILIPPLRERKSDISLLMDFFIIDACIKNNRCALIPSKQIREIMYLYNWPGNIDELKQYMDRVATVGDENVILENPQMAAQKKGQREYFFHSTSVQVLPQTAEIMKLILEKQKLSLKEISKEFITRTEKRLMRKALELTNWNRKKAAELLNISYKSMLNKIKAYGIQQSVC